MSLSSLINTNLLYLCFVNCSVSHDHSISYVNIVLEYYQVTRSSYENLMCPKFLQRIVTGLYLGLYKGRTYHFLGRDRGGIVGPPYWQIKRINPFFILNPFPYHKIMKIQIPPSSQILNCTHNITPGLKRKRTKKNSQGLQPL